MPTLTQRDRYRGCLLGLACGDAVGTTVEFSRRGTFPAITDMVGGGPFGLRPGQWTDDTSMALCLAHSLVYRQGFDPVDQMNRYCNWADYGYMSSTGECFDIGGTVSRALLGASKEEILPGSGFTPELPSVAALAGGAYRGKSEEEIRGSGYIVESLEAALWCFLTTRTYEDAVLRAANLGDDADTTAAICGQLAGAHYGMEAIPTRWRERVAMGAEIAGLADRLLELRETAPHSER